MEKTELNLPTLYADHHVMILREALLALDGVSEVYASSAWREAVVTPATLTLLPVTAPAAQK